MCPGVRREHPGISVFVGVRPGGRQVHPGSIGS